MPNNSVRTFPTPKEEFIRTTQFITPFELVGENVVIPTKYDWVSIKVQKVKYKNEIYAARELSFSYAPEIKFYTLYQKPIIVNGVTLHQKVESFLCEKWGKIDSVKYPVEENTWDIVRYKVYHLFFVKLQYFAAKVIQFAFPLAQKGMLNCGEYMLVVDETRFKPSNLKFKVIKRVIEDDETYPRFQRREVKYVKYLGENFSIRCSKTYYTDYENRINRTHWCDYYLYEDCISADDHSFVREKDTVRGTHNCSSGFNTVTMGELINNYNYDRIKFDYIEARPLDFNILNVCDYFARNMMEEVYPNNYDFVEQPKGNYWSFERLFKTKYYWP